ncbi:MAG: hypothetical protein J6S21_02605, partial [Victivallales bacterium]|nr:hypothetical protein [Victivallales bacterium]
MKFFLDGSDWEAEYYISLKDYLAWQRDPRKLYNMHLQDATAAGFLLADSNCKPSFKATIPGCDRSVLLENGVIQDPYWGRNMDQSRWSEEKSWAFRKFFVLPEEIKNRKRFQLRFCGIDYSATFFLNGEYLGSHTGAFVPFEADVTDYISRDGENLLAVIFEPMPKGLPNHNDPFNPQPTDFAEYHRSQLCFGWDWSRGMSAAGIWDHVYINANDDARISDCCFRGNAEGDVDLSVEIQSTLDARMPLNITLEPMNFQGESYTFTREVELEYGENICSFSLKCAAPQLWYPRGYGRQNLYRLKLEIAGEVTEKQVAFRTLKMLRNANSPERAYNLTFSFNGVPVFARGVNWVPAELMYNRSTREEYERLVRLAAEGNINLFRIWGGGIIEKDDFYALCDQYGIIVWQEFMHACSNYRKDGEYLAFKAREAEAILRKICNHVCVSMLCGGNEVLYYGEIPDSPL